MRDSISWTVGVIWTFLCLVLIAPAVHAAVGRTPGNFAVLPTTGAATYSIPIRTPPGPGGVQPNIALTYDSQQGNDLAGVGWGVTGLSSIARCNRTYAQDGAGAPVALTTADALCLDGKRLRLTFGSQGTAGSTYQTEIADFSNVTAVGTAGNGPASFSVQARDGRTYIYGNTADSRVLADGSTASSWLLNEVIDRAGNTLTVTYAAGTGTAVPSTISWTPSSSGSSSYNYTMVFSYLTASPQSSRYSYLAGTPVVDTHLLQSITINYAGAVVKEYFLSYQPSPTTARSELNQVLECADSAKASCLSPTTITYPNTSAGLTPTPITLATNVGTIVGVYDFDGDGRDDLLYGDNHNSLYVAFGTSSGFGTPVPVGTAGPNLFQTVPAPGYYLFTLAGDLHGTGKTSILTVINGTWWEYNWNSATNAFIGTDTTFKIGSTQTWGLADVNGDGLEDLLAVSYDSRGLIVSANINNSATSGPASFTGGLSGYSDPSKTCNAQQCAISVETHQSNSTRALDFNGDGLGDLILYTNATTCTGTCQSTSSKLILLSRGKDLVSAPAALNAVNSNNRAWTADVNDDNCTDVIIDNVVYVSGCNGTSPTQITLGASVLTATDWDGDGRTDLVVANGNTLGVYLSTGAGSSLAGFSSLTPTPIPNSGGSYFAARPTGDGLSTLFYSSASLTFSYYPHNGAGQNPDLVASITDGYGNSVTPTYTSITQGSYFTNSVAQPVYPYRLFMGPLYVVNQATFSDPSVGSYYQNYTYLSAWLNLQGRGLTNFKAFQQYDSRNQLWEKFGYGNVFPFANKRVSDTLSLDQAGTKPLKTTLLPLTTVTLDSTTNNQRYFVYNSSSTTSIYEVGGSQDGHLIRTLETDLTYDNYGNPTTIKTITTDSDSSSAYSNNTWTVTRTNTPSVDISRWCLSLFSQTQITYTASDGSTPVTRTKSLTPDTTNCRYSQVVTEPSSSTYKVTETLGYDSFGNVNSDTLTGINMAARATTTDWGTTGQFPMTLKDALNQPTTRTYDFSQGLLTSQTDPNNLTTHWAYDNFGRETQETRPDGTARKWNLVDCSTFNSCTTHTRTYLSSVQLDKNGGTITTDSTIISDTLDRPYQVVKKTRNTTASALNSMVQFDYDSLGRVARKSFPCLTANCSGATMYFATTTYDVLNRPIQVSRPQTATNSTTTSTTYQYAGDAQTITDANNHTRTLVTDPTGRLRRTTDAAGYSIILGYDAAGSQNSVADSLGNTLSSATYQYGLTAMQVSSLDADLGTWGYTFDALGELTAWTDAKNQHFSAFYDELSRLTDRYEPDLYTHWTWGSSAAAHEIGQLQSVCTGRGTNPAACAASTGYAEAETYDSVGRQATRAIQIPGDTTYTYSWTYDPLTGLIDTQTYPADSHGYRLALKYGYVNRLVQSITDTSDSPNKTLWTANADNERGQFTKETLGNNVIANHSFDAVTGLINNITSGVGSGAAIQNNAYLYDAVGNFTQRQDNNAGLTENIYMDPLNRLDHTVGDTGTQMTYDSMGRLATWAANGGTANTNDYTTPQAGCTYYNNAQPHAVRKSTTGGGTHWTTLCYDANGNLVQTNDNFAPGDVVQYSWTSYNQPASMTASSTGVPNSSSQFSYDHNHQRWQQIASYSGTPETTTYIGGFLEKMTNATTTAYRYYIPAGSNTIVYSRSSSGTNAIYYLGKDHLGSTAAITDQTGTRVASEKFAALGWNESSAADKATLAGISRHEFAGHEGIDNPRLGLVNMNGRIYQPFGSSFLSPDPTIPDPTDTRSYNRYAYVNYNPLSAIDPSGFTLELTPQQNGGGGGDDLPEIEINSDGGGGGFSSGDGGLPEITISAPPPPAGIEVIYPSPAAPPALGRNPPVSGPQTNDPLPVVVVQPPPKKAPPAQPPQPPEPLPIIVVNAAQQVALPSQLFAAKRPSKGASWKRSQRFKCTVYRCGAPHGGLHGTYCPECNTKSKDPNGGVPPNPHWSDDDEINNDPLPELDDPAPLQLPDLQDWLLWLERELAFG